MSNLNMSKLTKPLAGAALAVILGLAGCSLPGGGNGTEPVSSPPPVTQPAEPTPTPAQPAEPTPSQPQVDQNSGDMILLLTVGDTKYEIKCDDLFETGCSDSQQWVWNDRIKDDPTRFSNWLKYLSKNQLLTKTEPATLRLVLGAGLNAATVYLESFDKSLTAEKNLQNGYKAFSPLYPDDSDKLKQAYFASAVSYFWGQNKDGESI